MTLPKRCKILVTGAAGVMGSRLVRGLIDDGYQVRALILPQDPIAIAPRGVGVRDSRRQCGRLRVYRRLCDGIDTVYHLAAMIISSDPSVFQSVNCRERRT